MFRFESHANDPLGNDFRPTVNPLGGGNGPRDMVLFGDAGDERLMVVAAGSSQVLVIDPSTSKTNALVLKVPAQHILKFEGGSPRDSRRQTHALLYNDSLNGITFFDPEDLGDNPEDRLEVLSTPSPVKNLISLEEDGKVVLLQQTGLSVLDLTAHTITPIASDMTLATATFDPMRKRLWAVPMGESHIGTLDLTTGKTDEIRLDAPVRTLVPMFAEGRLCALHEADIGYVTLVELDEPDREHAISVRGFFVNNLLDRGAE
jgi:hypothetical protein